MSEDRLERAKELGGNVARNGWQIFKSELRFLLGSFFGPFFKALLLIGLPLALFCVYSVVSGILRGELPNDALHWIFALPLSVAYALTVAGPIAMGVAACVSAWKLAGPWVLVPLILIPLALVLAFLVMSPVIGAAGVALGAALLEAGAEHHWMVAELGPAARIGPPILILALPLLILDLGAILFSPAVLGCLFLLLLAVLATLALALIPSGVASFLAVAFGFVRRFLRRHGERLKRIHLDAGDSSSGDRGASGEGGAGHADPR